MFGDRYTEKEDLVPIIEAVEGATQHLDPDGFCVALNTGDRHTSAFMLCTGAQAETSVYTKNALARLMVAMEQDARSEAAVKQQEVAHG